MIEEIYTSGWAIGNKKAGVGIVFMANGIRDRAFGKFIGEATSHSCFLVAMIVALQELSEPSDVIIYTHNQAIAKCANGEYARNSNLDMWREYDIESEQHKITVVWIKKGSHKGNVLANKLAKNAVSYYESKR